MGSVEKRGRLIGGPLRSPGTRVPLFDRLADHEPRQEETQPRRVLAHGDVHESIRRELFRLFNTRCAARIDEVAGRDRTVIDFGVPDFGTLNPTSERDRQQVARLLVDAVRAFEPRLQQPRVEVQVRTGTPGILDIRLDAELQLDALLEPVSFPFTVEWAGGGVRVTAPPPAVPAAAV